MKNKPIFQIFFLEYSRPVQRPIIRTRDLHCIIALVDNTGPTLGYTLIEPNKKLNAADNNQETMAQTSILDPNPRVCAFECAFRTDCVGFAHTPAGPDVRILLREILPTLMMRRGPASTSESDRDNNHLISVIGVTRRVFAFCLCLRFVI